jgi:hypothetical protein
MIGIFVTFRYGESFDERAVRTFGHDVAWRRG